jgi:TonB family protein
MRFSTVIVVLALAAAAPALSAAPQGAEGPVYTVGDGVSAPVVVKQVKPQYTAEARRAKVEGTVILEAIVETDGTVGDVTVTKGLEPGLDEQAVKAARLWRFEPGKKDGKAVRVRITLEMTFTLK